MKSLLLSIVILMSVPAMATSILVGPQPIARVLNGVSYSSHWTNPTEMVATVEVACGLSKSRVEAQLVPQEKYINGEAQTILQLVTVLVYEYDLSAAPPVCAGQIPHQVKINLESSPFYQQGMLVEVVGGHHLQLEMTPSNPH